MNQSIQQNQNIKSNNILKGRYQLIEKLSEGSYGNVYKAYDQQENKHVAIKKIKKITDGYGMTATNIREFSALKNLKYQFLYNLPKSDKPNTSMVEFYMIFEYIEMDLTQLFIQYIAEQCLIPVIQIKSLMYQMIKGIYTMHSNLYIHRDLKPQNILITNEGEVKIADLGLARKIESRRQNLTPGWITIWYRPLEMLKGQSNYTLDVDIWSLGCIFGELCILSALFKGSNETQQAIKIIEKFGLPTDFSDFNADFQEYIPEEILELEQNAPFLPKEGIDLMKKMLEINPSKRITAKQCLDHPFFDEIRDMPLSKIKEQTIKSKPEYQLKYIEFKKMREMQAEQNRIKQLERQQKKQQQQMEQQLLQQLQQQQTIQKQASQNQNTQKEHSLEASPELL